MEAKWLQNGSLEGSGQALGADSASRGSPEPSWRGPGVPKNSLLAAWGLPGAESGSISPPRRLPGRVPEWLWDVILGAFFREGLPARKK